MSKDMKKENLCNCNDCNMEFIHSLKEEGVIQDLIEALQDLLEALQSIIVFLQDM